jgi:hypothetical protein
MARKAEQKVYRSFPCGNLWRPRMGSTTGRNRQPLKTTTGGLQSRPVGFIVEGIHRRRKEQELTLQRRRIHPPFPAACIAEVARSFPENAVSFSDMRARWRFGLVNPAVQFALACGPLGGSKYATSVRCSSNPSDSSTPSRNPDKPYRFAEAFLTHL